MHTACHIQSTASQNQAVLYVTSKLQHSPPSQKQPPYTSCGLPTSQRSFLALNNNLASNSTAPETTVRTSTACLPMCDNLSHQSQHRKSRRKPRRHKQTHTHLTSPEITAPAMLCTAAPHTLPQPDTRLAAQRAAMLVHFLLQQVNSPAVWSSRNPHHDLQQLTLSARHSC